MTDDVPPDTPSVRPERAKTGRAKPPPRAKLTMDMLLARATGVDALLASLSTIRFSTARLCPPFLFSLFLPQKSRWSPPCMHTTGDAETQRRNLAVLMKQYRLWGQAMVPQLAFDRFLVSLERLASKREFRDRVDAMQHDNTPFSSTTVPTVPAPAQAEGADTTTGNSGSSVVIVQGLASHNDKDGNNVDEEPFDPSTIDPDDLVEAQEQRPQDQTVADDELDELERMAAEAEAEEAEQEQ